MNVCMFTNTYLPHVGGVARSVASFALDLRKLGHRVQVVAPTFANEDGSQAEEEDDVLRVPAIQHFSGSDFSVRIPLPFIIDDKIDEFRPDVIHSHHPFLLGDAAFRAAYRRGLPLVFTHHTLYEQYVHYVSPESEYMKQIAINLATKYANLCNLVIAPSGSIARLITERGVTSPIEVIPTGVDFEYFRSGDGESFRRFFGIPMNAQVVGHLGRLAPEKNLEYLCDAVIKALKKMPDETRFLVIGSGPDDSLIQEMFQKEGLEDRLIMAGSQSGRKLADAYNAMNLFVFSSKSETQGMVLTEAMAASTPVIALDASGARDVVIDDQNGRLLPGDAPSQLFAETIVDFFERKDNADPWRQGAVNTARKFSRDASAEKLSRVYRSLQGKNSRGKFKSDETPDSGDDFQRSLETEWKLLSEKMGAIIETVRNGNNDP
ncbi:MAG: glycosyltransferase [Thermovirgaceae bacterium]|nr:glycosyltransferase [Thermovirgaceae bacterium]